MTNLAAAYRAAGRWSDALPLAREVVDRQKVRRGGEDSITLSSMALLAGIHEGSKDWSQAEPLHRERLAAVRKKNAPDTPAVAVVEFALGRNLLAQQKFAEAESLLRAALATREQRLPEDWLTFNARSLLGAALVGQKRFTEAEPLLISGFEGMKAREEKIPRAAKGRLKDALERLVQLFTARNEPENAAAWQKKLDALETTQRPATAPQP
ncbi:MAG: tetratricopeptide repeat protein [Verrucomicrobia bacterium]|nr:tetratricopeptide repeat protein [Verrucomicrobiota bacterium]